MIVSGLVVLEVGVRTIGVIGGILLCMLTSFKITVVDSYFFVQTFINDCGFIIRDYQNFGRFVDELVKDFTLYFNIILGVSFECELINFYFPV